jgi:hypothetical protein
VIDGWESVWGPEGRELLGWAQGDPLAHRAAGALMRHALQDPVPTYVSEDVDSTCWLAHEATDLAHLIETGLGSVDEVTCLLASTGWWDPDREGPERPLAVAYELGIVD